MINHSKSNKTPWKSRDREIGKSYGGSEWISEIMSVTVKPPEEEKYRSPDSGIFLAEFSRKADRNDTKHDIAKSCISMKSNNLCISGKIIFFTHTRYIFYI